MPRSRNTIGFGRVNLIKKVKVDGKWRFCPALFEPGRRLNDLVRVHGQIETHSEGTYYLEWREKGKRRRQPMRNRALIFEQARLKALELEAERKGSAPAADTSNLTIQAGGHVTHTPTPIPVPAPSLVPAAIAALQLPAVHLIWKGIESYLEEMIGASVRSQLAKLGMMPAQPMAQREPSNVTAFSPNAPEEKKKENGRETLFPAEEPIPAGKILIADAIASYLKDVEPPQREPKTYDEYRLVLHKFRDTCTKRYVREITRDDLLDFRRHLYSFGNEARTVFNRMGIVLQLLKLHGVERLLKKGDKPKFVLNVREMYQPEDLEALFKACTADEKVLYLFFLLTGERDKEVRHTAWSDIDFSRNVVRVTSKKQLGFKPKDKEEREIPVPASLLSTLREHKKRQSGPNPHNLVFPTARGKPDRKFENKLKRISNRAGLNCGSCVSKHGNKCTDADDIFSAGEARADFSKTDKPMQRAS